jgi:serine/threonine protein kinase
VGDAARVFADVADGLAHVHERGLVHRDVKPGNVMVRPDGRAVLLDFGLAFAPGEPLPDDPTIVGGRGYVLGTTDYMAPEQARDATAIGPAADLYGLGCTLAFALTGVAPFPAATTKEKIKRHRDDPPPALAHLPSAFVRIVHRLMAKAPAQRPASAAEARDLLLGWATSAPAASAVDAVESIDAPGSDARLWDAAPGDDVPEADLVEEAEEVHELEGMSDADEPLELPPVEARRGCVGVVLLLAGVAFAVFRP